MKIQLAGICLGLFANVLFAADMGTVPTRYGLVSRADTRVAGVAAFHGIPYAAPPVGTARWKPPARPAHWDGIRDGSRFGNRCIQTNPFDDMIWNSESESEDCLYLSVWAPGSKKDLPVMVWIHGGGFASGSGDETRHDGARLASMGVVVVTLNYRLGVMGFLSHPDLRAETGHSGNYGMLDIVAALEWVADNVSAFGGDPGNVTIFGESAGSVAVSALMASPMAAGLFHRAIGQSGAMFETARQPATGRLQAETAGKAFAEVAGADSLEALRGMPPAALVDAVNEQQARFGPVLDDHFLPSGPTDVFAKGKQNDVPLLVGWTSAETKWVQMNLEQFISERKELFPAHAEQADRFYPAVSDDEAMRRGIELSSDFWLVYGTWKWAESQRSSGQAPVYRYLFDQVQAGPGSPVPADDPGAAHATDIPFVFDTMDYLGNPVSAADRETAERMMAYWVSFARSGNPDAFGLPVWPKYGPQTDYPVMRFRAGSVIEPDSGRQRLEFLDSVLAP